MQDTYTDNLNLKKPDKKSLYDISDFNDNADIIDSAIEGKVNKINNGTENNLVSISQNDDIADSGIEVNKVLLAEIFAEYIRLFGGFKKYTSPGTYTFKVPAGITQIKVALIGGGGGGGGSITNYGGGGGGRGAYIIDQTIDVTPREILTLVVGAGGTGGAGYTDSTDGSDGTPSYVKRGDTELISVEAGKKGTRAYYGYNYGSPGYGGTIGGTDGIYNGIGKGGTTTYFGIYGDGGDAGDLYNSSYPSASNGKPGKNGAIVIYFPGATFSDIVF